MRVDPTRAAVRPLRFCLSGLALIACLLTLQSQFRLVLVVGESMRPTLSHGDLLVADRRAFRHRDPERGDLVVTWLHREMIVKRVVGLPGELVEVVDGSLFVNDRLVVEPTGPAGDSLNIRRGRLAADRFAVLGDNRGLLEGQTVHAIISKNDIVGLVVVTIPTRRIPAINSDVESPILARPRWSRLSLFEWATCGATVAGPSTS
jgi:signal peptidase I